MNIRLAIGLGGLNLSLLASAILATYASPAVAQGQNVDSVQKVGICPVDWHEGGTRPGQSGVRGRCYPDSSSSPKIYLRASNSEACAPGYYDWDRYCTTRKPTMVSAENSRALPTKLTKPAPNARCPLGWASTRDLQSCYTTIEGGTTARLKNGKACAPGELDEWGIWCTANYKGIDKERAGNAAAKDWNEVYAWTVRNKGDTKTVGDDFSPAATAYFNSVAGAGKGANSAAAPAAAQTSQSKPEKTCNDGSAAGSATGAAIGGVVGGSTGAAIGGTLGGLGKKKKQPGC